MDCRHKLDVHSILHILDNFLIIGRDNSFCSTSLSKFLKTYDELGVPVAPDKTVGPSTVLSFAGIELDTCAMEARLPNDKLEKCRFMLQGFLKHKKVSLKEMQSLIGLLNFTCSVVSSGRTFLRRTTNVTVGVCCPTYLIRLTRDVKEDLKMWLQFLDHFNGKSFFLDFIWHFKDIAFINGFFRFIGLWCHFWT